VLPPYMAQPLDYYYSNATDGTIELGANTGEDLDAIRDRYPDRRVFYVVTWDILAWIPPATRWTGLIRTQSSPGNVWDLPLLVG